MRAPQPNTLYDRDAQDWYVEPAWCTDLLIRAEPFEGSVWDPACGGGNLIYEFHRRGYIVLATDIVERGCWLQRDTYDFLAPMSPVDSVPGSYTVGFPFNRLPDNIVCNPPYRLTEAFIYRALTIARHKVAMLTNLRFLASQRRHRLFAETPVRRVHVFSTRPSMPPGTLLESGERAAQGGSQDYCWIVWEHGFAGAPTLNWLIRD